MTENNEVTARNLIDMITYHLDNESRLTEVNSDGYASASTARRDYTDSYKNLQEKLDAYVDQRIMKKLVDLKLIVIKDPID